MKHNHQVPQLQATFVHSLFRSGSTFIYNLLKQTGLYHVYHEPMHEIIASLPTAWNDLDSRKENLKKKMRHGFLQGGYFDEYAHLLPEIKKNFDTKLSFDLFFLDQDTSASQLRTYLDVLIEGSPKSPVLQCTRTIGRVNWLKANYTSKHVYLLRNPWDQWYSYKVDSYISATPRIIYSQNNLPDVLQDIMKSKDLLPLQGADASAKLRHSYSHPISPEDDYFLFFGLWLYAYIAGQKYCDVMVDMDKACSTAQYRNQIEQRLADINLTSIKLDNIHLHRTVFSEYERDFYEKIEDRVLEILSGHTVESAPLQAANEYLNLQRNIAFVSNHQIAKKYPTTFEDAKRMREIILFNGQHSAEVASNLNLAVADRDEQIANLNLAVADRDEQIANLTNENARQREWALDLDAELKEERARLLAITRSNSWRLTLPLREARRWVFFPGEQYKRYVKGSLRLAKRVYKSLPLSYQTKATHRNLLAKYFPRVLLASYYPNMSVSSLSSSQSGVEIYLKQFHDSSPTVKTIDIPASQNPLVSIIIPIYGKIDYTLRCLGSIASNPPRAEFEVIVVDDCSTDDSAEVLTNLKGIRLVRNPINKGFIRSCNSGADAAQGKYLHFLNNDTQVTPGWLDELVRTYQKFPGAGLVGSKLVYPDGKLQEAGGIIWQDGSAWNFGRDQDPQLPIFNYAREVDYCSGASIMIPKALFEELGGFDEHYLPAYCEDSDLALKIRKKGYRVIYQPMSTVVHYEGITSGIDTTEGTKAYQVENTKKLYVRWKTQLLSHQRSAYDVDNAKDRRATRRVLVLDHCTPTPNQDAGSVTVFNLLLLLREMNFQVTFIPEGNFLYMPEYTPSLQGAGFEVLYAPYVTSVDRHLKDFGERYDLALLFRPVVAERHMKKIRKYCPKAKVLFHTVDLHFLRMSREAVLQSDHSKHKAADKMKQCELTAIRTADASIVHSTAEFELLHPELPDAKLHVFPLIMDVPGSEKSFIDRCDIAFVGGYQHTPNVDAVQYFVSEVMPLLRKRLPGVCFYIVGSRPPSEIQSLASEDIIITGFVEDLTSLLDKMRISVVPLRYGAGIKGKIGTAMAVGLPVVATSLAVEGMSLIDGEHILVADGAQAFAEAVVKLYRDETLWYQISKSGLEFAANAWGAEASWKTLSTILEDIDLKVAGFSYSFSLYSESRYDVKGVTTRSNILKPINSIADPDKLKKSLRSESTSAVLDDYQKKTQQELAIYENQVNVHDLPEIFHYWSNKYLTPIFHDGGFETIADFFSSNLLDAKNRTGNATARFISIGAGNCDLEVSVVKNFIEAGFKDFILECLEFNPAMLKRGKEIARENGILNNMCFVEADFNAWVAREKYDGVLANQSLHHVTCLEHLFDQIKDSLHADGSFVISDMIGRNGHQRWPESLEIVNKYWKELLNKYKFNVLLDRYEKEYENWDCSKEGFEGIRAQDILPLLLKRFQCEKFIGYGSAIDIFVDRAFGHNFNPKSHWDCEFIDRVHAEDEEGLKSGKLTPTHMMAVFVKTMHCSPYYSRGIHPMRSVRGPLT